MAIIKAENEILANVRGNKNIHPLDEYIDQAEDMTLRWQNRMAVSKNSCPVELTPDLNACYVDQEGKAHLSDISEYAFTQLCSKVGVPASYVMKCFNNGKPELAIYNFNEWSREMKDDQSLLVRDYEGVARAVLSDRYNVFNTASVLQNVKKAVESNAFQGRYELNQIYMSQDKLHMRFVDFNNPIKVGKNDLTPGFTVSSSDVGSGSLNIKYFLYRFACKNGIVMIKNGGMLFRKTHLADFEDVGAKLFMNALENIDTLNAYAGKQLEAARTKMLSVDEMNLYLSKAQKELQLGKGESAEALNDLLKTTYTDHNVLSFVHAVTEHAQRYTLERRVEHETWAGNILSSMAA